MATKADIIKDQTHKEEELEIGARVFCTLTSVEELQVKRTAKAVGLLVEHLQEKGILKEQEIDGFLFECVT